LVEASATFNAKQTRLFLIGRDGAKDAEKMSQALNADPSIVLLDDEGAVYDKFALERVFFSLQQQSAAFVIDKRMTLSFAYVVTNQLQWLGKGAANALFQALDKLPAG
jgi:hypothetical protein